MTGGTRFQAGDHSFRMGEKSGSAHRHNSQLVFSTAPGKAGGALMHFRSVKRGGILLITREASSVSKRERGSLIPRT